MNRYSIKYDLATHTGVRYGMITKSVTIEYYIWDNYLEGSVKDIGFRLSNLDDLKSEFFIVESKNHPHYLDLQQRCLQLNIDHLDYLNHIISYCNG